MTMSSPMHCFLKGNYLDSDHFLSTRLRQELERQRRETENLIKHKEKHCGKEMRTKAEQHRECARHLQAMSSYFSPDTPAVFATAVGIMDSALMKINIPGKYLSCFSAACYLLASKWVLDDYPPTPSSLARIHYKQWREADVIRMEVKILGILEWELPKCTYLSFLPTMMKALFGLDEDMSVPFDVIRQAQLILLQEFSFTFKPAAVALGVLNHLAQRSLMTASMAHTIMALQDAVQVCDSELHEVSVLLDVHTHSSSHSQPSLKPNSVGFPKTFKGPYASFLPDYQLHIIPEESKESLSELDLENSVSSPSHTDLSVFFSDCDYSYSEDEEEVFVKDLKDDEVEDNDSGCDQDSDDQESNEGQRSKVAVAVSSCKDIIQGEDDSGVCDSSGDEGSVCGSL